MIIGMLWKLGQKWLIVQRAWRRVLDWIGLECHHFQPSKNWTFWAGPVRVHSFPKLPDFLFGIRKWWCHLFTYYYHISSCRKKDKYTSPGESQRLPGPSTTADSPFRTPSLWRSRSVTVSPAWKGRLNKQNKKRRNKTNTLTTMMKMGIKMGSDHCYWYWFSCDDDDDKHTKLSANVCKIQCSNDRRDDASTIPGKSRSQELLFNPIPW